MAKKNQEIIDSILSCFRLDKLCPKCNSPMEVGSITSCNSCKNEVKLAIALDIIETTAMQLRFGIISKAKPKPPSKPKKPVKKPTVKRTPKKSTVKKPAKSKK